MSSLTVMPTFFARCSWISRTTSWLSTCCSISGTGGSGRRCSGGASCCCRFKFWMVRSRVSASSLLRTTPSLTTAAIPSSSSPPAPSPRSCALAAGNHCPNTMPDTASRKRLRKMLMGSLFSVGSGDVAVAQNTTVEQLVRRGHALRQALQLELHRDRVVGLARAAAHVVAVDHSQAPAAGLVLPADEVFEPLLVEERVAVAADEAPALRQRPDDGHVALLERVAPVAIADAEQAILLRTVLEARFGPGRCRGLAVPLIAHVERPRVAQADTE